MSKKNNKATKKRAHAFALQREQAEQERLKAKQAKKEAKVERVVVQEGAVAKRKAKPKAIRLRKGVVVKGIKIVDADSKRKALRRLQAEAAARMMDSMVEGDEAVAAVPATTKTLQLKKKTLRKKAAVRMAAKKKKKPPGAAGSAAPAEAASIVAMEL